MKYQLYMHINLKKETNYNHSPHTFCNNTQISPVDISPFYGHNRRYSDHYDEIVNFRLEEDCNQEENFEVSRQDYNQGISQNLSLLQGYQLDRKVGLAVQNQIIRYTNSDQQVNLIKQIQQANSNGNTSLHKPQIEHLIEFLVVNTHKSEQAIMQEAQRIEMSSEELGQIFRILYKKFKKLKKTKEEMTKYCMRKAFKYIADKSKKNRVHNRDVDLCMKNYFSKNCQTFSIPFKKNSTEKTMNGNFLKRIFSSSCFVDDYREFLDQFKELIEDDNAKKIMYLAQTIKTCLRTNDTKRIEGIKRLPWPKDTLEKTENLGHSLISYADNNQGTLSFIRKERLQTNQK